jgi:hypothetical protein
MKPVLLARGAALALDDAYGPFYDGYWGRDRNFWYFPGRGRPYARDEGHHFAHVPSGGMPVVHGRSGMFHRH